MNIGLDDVERKFVEFCELFKKVGCEFWIGVIFWLFEDGEFLIDLIYEDILDFGCVLECCEVWIVKYFGENLVIDW